MHQVFSKAPKGKGNKTVTDLDKSLKEKLRAKTTTATPMD